MNCKDAALLEHSQAQLADGAVDDLGVELRLASAHGVAGIGDGLGLELGLGLGGAGAAGAGLALGVGAMIAAGLGSGVSVAIGVGIKLSTGGTEVRFLVSPPWLNPAMVRMMPVISRAAPIRKGVKNLVPAESRALFREDELVLLFQAS